MGANVISSLYVEFAADTKKFAAAMQDISRQVREVEKVVKPFKDRAADAGRAFSIGFTVPIVAGFAAVTKAGMDFESAFAGVRKTVDTNEAGFAKLRQGIRDMSLVVPAAATEIAAVAENAGQLGIKAEDILKFSKVMIDLGKTTNLSAVEASQALARFTNITGTSKNDIDKLGSALFKLDVNSASSAREITEFALRIAASGKIVGLTDPQILAFGASLSSVGIEAEAGGTAISKTFTEIANSVAGGGKKLQQFAAVAGMSSADFQKAFKHDAADAVVTFIEGLKRVRTEGGNIFHVLDEMGLKNVRLRNALLASSEAGSLLRDNIVKAGEAFKENTALTAGAAERYKTTASQIQLLKNQLTDIGITLFDSLGPVLRDTVIPNLKTLTIYAADAAKQFNSLSPEVKSFTLAILAIGAVVGPAILALVKISSTIIGLGSLAIKAGFSITAMNAAIAGIGLLGAVKTYGDLSAAVSLIGGTSAAATGGLIALAAAVGVAIGMFINWILKITGLQAGFDKLLKTTVEYVPIIGKWATGANAAADAAKSATGTTEKLVAEFKKYNITVDVARLGDASYMRSLTAMVQERQKATAATKVATTTNKDAKDSAKALTDQAELMNAAFADGPSAKKLQELRDSLEKAVRPADFLNKELEKYRALGATNTELARGFADEIVKAAEGQELHGIAVQGVVAQLLSEATAFTKVEEAAKFLKKFREDMKNAPPLKLVEFDLPDKLTEDLRSKTLAGINDSKTAVYQLNDALAQMKYLAPEDAVRLFGDQLKAAAVYARTYGENALSPTTQRLIEFMERTEDAKDRLDAWNASSNKGVEALSNMRDGVKTTIEAIKRLQNQGASAKQIIGVFGGDIKTLGENAKLLGIQLDEPTKALIRMQEQTERTSELAKKLKDAWSTAVGNITSQFADGVTDMIFSGKKFSVSIKNIFVDLGKSMVKILVTDAFSSITKGFSNMLLGLGGGGNKGLLGGVLGSLGGKLAGLLGIGGGAAAAGAGAGAAGAGGAAAAGGGAAGGGAGLAALATNPITIAAAAAIAGALIIKKFVGQGRKTANEFVQNVQNPFGSNLSNIVDTFDAAKKAGTLTLEQAQESKNALTELWSSFVSTANQFATQGDNEAKVVKQAFDSLSQYFGTDLSKVFGPMDETIKALQLAAQNATAGANVPGVGAGIPQTGRAQSASEIFAKAVERFEAAVDRIGTGGAAGAAAGGIVVQYEDKREINFYGLSESLQTELRETIEPLLMRDFENNTRGITAALIAILNNASGGVTNTVPATT